MSDDEIYEYLGQMFDAISQFDEGHSENEERYTIVGRSRLMSGWRRRGKCKKSSCCFY